MTLLLLIGLGDIAVAQELNNLNSKYWTITKDTTQLDSLSIDPSSISILINDSTAADTSAYEIDPINGLLIWKTDLPTDSIRVDFRTLPFKFNEPYGHRSTDMIQPEESYFDAPLTYRNNYQTNDVFESTKLNKTGSISRGIGFGNNQDLTVNSTLSLQLNGKLTDRISVLASITDNNIPIQPEGNTAQLQEFDQVYIQLYDERSKLTAGDFILKRPDGYFVNYFKRAQGASFTTRQPFGKSNDKYVFTETSAAVSKGKFARNIIQGQEGNQGPYRLIGNEDEFYIVILAGTEKVFIDGKELKRGQEHDYIIDYNTAEVTFTSNQLINKDKRIVIEFQYSDANYVRSLIQTSTGMETDKYKVYLNFYSEQDAKNQPLQQDLTDADKFILSEVGDELALALAPSFTAIDEYNNNQVLYTRTDSLGYSDVFVRIYGQTSEMYSVNFSSVEAGNGDYIQDGFDATGRIFVWVAPDTISGQIIKNGNYAPVRRLIAPNKKQMLMAGAIMDFTKQTQVKVEGGFSNSNLNTFSEKDDGDNISHGVKLEASHGLFLSKNPDAMEMRFLGSFESIGDNFSPIEPYRSVEFNRNWNLDYAYNLLHQEMFTGGLAIRKQKKLTLDYSLDHYSVGDVYKGLKNQMTAESHLKGFDAWFTGSVLNTSGLEKTDFSRHKLRVEKKLWITKIGYSDEQETNKKYVTDTDQLSDQSYRFYDWKIYLTELDSSKIGYEVFYRERKDYGSDVSAYKGSTVATQYGLETYFLQNPKNQIRASVSNRILKILDSDLTTEEPESTLIGRLEHTMRLAKNAITSNLYYEIGSGLERRQEYVYVPDPTGQGAYTWIDYNDDGIKDLNEFELARPEDGDRYIRVFTPTDNYERAYSNQFSQSLNINPAAIWAGKTGFLKGLSKISNQTAFRVQRKTRREEGSNRFNPFLLSVGDSTLISQSSSIRNTVFFNRSSSKFGVDYTYSSQFAKSPLTTGFEARSNSAQLLRVRYNFGPKTGIILENGIGNQESQSDVITGRNFLIDYYSLVQTFTYQPNTALKASLSNSYTNKTNQPEYGGETAQIIDLGIDCRFSRAESGTMFAQLNYITIDYSGLVNSSLSYEMLDGLQNGQNITWGAGIQRNLGRNLQLSLSYNGRKSEEVKSVHTGSAQVRAFF